MHLELREITNAKEALEATECYLDASTQPTSPFTDLIAPVRGEGETALRDRVVDFAVRQWFDHSADPTSRYFKVVDTDASDKVVSTWRWNIYTGEPGEGGSPSYPSPSPEKASAFWLPEGPTRRYTEAVLNNLAKLKARPQPHVYCLFAMTAPAYRRKGAGHLMMKWAMEQADKLGVESFIEGSPAGSRLYAQYGFRISDVVDLGPGPALEEGNEEWQQIKAQMVGLRCAVLRRPVGGVWDGPDESAFPKADYETNFWDASVASDRLHTTG